MYLCEIENKDGDSVRLTGAEDRWQVISIDGLDPPDVSLYSYEIAGMDGKKVTGGRLATREIVILLALRGDIEANRMTLYGFFMAKMPCRVYFTNGARNVYADGIVKKVEAGLFTNLEQMQIMIECPTPYFQDRTERTDDITKLHGLFEFPFAINANSPIAFSDYDSDRVADVYLSGEAESGMVIQIDATGAFQQITIQNTLTGEHIGLSDTSGFQSGDRILISTYRGNKSVMRIRGSATTSLLGKLETGFTFLQLSPGHNYFSYEVDDGESDGNATVKFIHRPLYQGV